MTADRRLDTNFVGDVTLVHIRDRKIMKNMDIQELGVDLFHLVEVENHRRMVLNFSAVESLSRLALDTLVKLHKKVKSKSGTLVLCSVRPEIQEVFTITNLDRVFVIKENESDALAFFA
jgi:anti-sigma B factor antagonist